MVLEALDEVAEILGNLEDPQLNEVHEEVDGLLMVGDEDEVVLR